MIIPKYFGYLPLSTFTGNAVIVANTDSFFCFTSSQPGE